MKLYQLSLFFLLASLVYEAMLTLPLGFAEYPKGKVEGLSEAQVKETHEELNRTIGKEMGSEPSGILATAFAIWRSVQLVWQGISFLARVIGNVTIFAPAFVNHLTGGYVPFIFVNIIGVGIAFVFVVGIVQFILGRGMREME